MLVGAAATPSFCGREAVRILSYTYVPGLIFARTFGYALDQRRSASDASLSHFQGPALLSVSRSLSLSEGGRRDTRQSKQFQVTRRVLGLGARPRKMFLLGACRRVQRCRLAASRPGRGHRSMTLLHIP